MGTPPGSFVLTPQNDATRTCIADWLGVIVVDPRDNSAREVQTSKHNHPWSRIARFAESQFLVARYPIPR